MASDGALKAKKSRAIQRQKLYIVIRALHRTIVDPTHHVLADEVETLNSLTSSLWGAPMHLPRIVRSDTGAYVATVYHDRVASRLADEADKAMERDAQQAKDQEHLEMVKGARNGDPILRVFDRKGVLLETHKQALHAVVHVDMVVFSDEMLLSVMPEELRDLPIVRALRSCARDIQLKKRAQLAAEEMVTLKLCEHGFNGWKMSHFLVMFADKQGWMTNKPRVCDVKVLVKEEQRKQRQVDHGKGPPSNGDVVTTSRREPEAAVATVKNVKVTTKTALASQQKQKGTVEQNAPSTSRATKANTKKAQSTGDSAVVPAASSPAVISTNPTLVSSTISSTVIPSGSVKTSASADPPARVTTAATSGSAIFNPSATLTGSYRALSSVPVMRASPSLARASQSSKVNSAGVMPFEEESRRQSAELLKRPPGRSTSPLAGFATPPPPSKRMAECKGEKGENRNVNRCLGADFAQHPISPPNLSSSMADGFPQSPTDPPAFTMEMRNGEPRNVFRPLALSSSSAIVAGGDGGHDGHGGHDHDRHRDEGDENVMDQLSRVTSEVQALFAQMRPDEVQEFIRALQPAVSDHLARRTAKMLLELPSACRDQFMENLRNMI